jgi:hypothetical protein
MKRVMEMSFGDLVLTKLAVFLSSCWLIGLLATYWPFQMLIFLINNKWWLLLLALIIAIIPMKRFFKSDILKTSPKKKSKRSKK